MTTITTSLEKMIHRLEPYDTEHTDVPEAILRRVQSVIFCKNLTSGKMKEASHPGVFMKRVEDGNWSNPVAVHFLEGTVTSWYAFGDFDLMILICDEDATRVLETMGQCGFGDDGYRCVPGINKLSKSFDQEEFNAQVKANPDYLKAAFCYHVGPKRFYPATIVDVVFQFRYSSNQKYYESRNASLHNILQNEDVHLSGKHEQQVKKANAILKRIFSLPPPLTPQPPQQQEQFQNHDVSGTEAGFTPSSSSSGFYMAPGWGGMDPNPPAPAGIPTMMHYHSTAHPQPPAAPSIQNKAPMQPSQPAESPLDSASQEEQIQSTSSFQFS